MRTMTKLAGLAAGSVALLFGVGWLGLRVKPQPFPPHPERTRELETAELPPTCRSRYNGISGLRWARRSPGSKRPSCGAGATST
jgi:hypothetical protein